MYSPTTFKKLLRRTDTPVFYSMLPNPLWALFFSTALGVALIASARADLLVLQPGGGGAGFGHVARFDPATGSPGVAFGHENEAFYAMCVTPENEVFVSANILGYGLIYRFNAAGEFLGKVADVMRTDFLAMTAGPDGALYCTAAMTDDLNSPERRAGIVRIGADGMAAVFIDEGSGGMRQPGALGFGPDGNLYVADAAMGVIRFSGSTGAPIDVFVPLGRGGLQDCSALVFGADGTLDLASSKANAVLRFDANTGAYAGVLVGSGAGGLSNPRALAFGPGGSLYIASHDTHLVLRYDARTGRYLGSIGPDVSLRSPTAIAFTATERLAGVPAGGADVRLDLDRPQRGMAWQSRHPGENGKGAIQFQGP